MHTGCSNFQTRKPCYRKDDLLEHKDGNISQTRKDRENVATGISIRNSPMHPFGLLPKISHWTWTWTWTCSFERYHPDPTQNSNRYYLRNGSSYLARTITGTIQIKAHENFWRNGSVGVSRDGPIFLGTPFPKTGVRTPPKTPIGIISGTGQAIWPEQ